MVRKPQREMLPANKKRAGRIKKLIRGYSGDRFGSLETDITDVMADIRHLCEANGLMYGVLELNAFEHYCQESN